MDSFATKLSLLAILTSKYTSKFNVFAGDHLEDIEVLRTVREGQFNLHGVVIGIGEDAVLLYVFY